MNAERAMRALEPNAEAGNLMAPSKETKTYRRLDDFEANWHRRLPANEAYEMARFRDNLAESKGHVPSPVSTHTEMANGQEYTV